MKLKEIISEVELEYPTYKNINIGYFADFYDKYTGEILLPNEFIGIANYHDGFLDDSEDPDGWSLEDEIETWEYRYIEDETISIAVNLGRWE